MRIYALKSSGFNFWFYWSWIYSERNAVCAVDIKYYNNSLKPYVIIMSFNALWPGKFYWGKVIWGKFYWGIVIWGVNLIGVRVRWAGPDSSILYLYISLYTLGYTILASNLLLTITLYITKKYICTVVFGLSQSYKITLVKDLLGKINKGKICRFSVTFSLASIISRIRSLN